MSFSQAVIYSILGVCVVFFALALLMIIIKLLIRFTPAESMQPAAVPMETAKPALKAPGTAGDLKLYGTDPKDAAMIMAIVADKLQTPINELRFISIREVKE